MIDVQADMELCCTQLGDSITNSYVHAWSQTWSLVYTAMSYGAMSPGEGQQASTNYPCKRKTRLDAEKELWKFCSQLSLTLGNVPHV